MDYQEKRSISIMCTQIVIATVYFMYVTRQYINLSADSDVLVFWAKTVVVMVPVFIIGHLISLFVFATINKQITGEGFPRFTDERDQLVELKSIRVEYFGLLFAVFITMIVLWNGAGITTAFITLISGMLLSGFLSQVARFVLYRLNS